MKSAVLRRICAAVLGTVLIVPIAARPAHAQDYEQYRQVGVDMLLSLADKLNDGRLSAAEVNELIQQVLAAITGVQSDVVGRLDSQLVADLKAKVESAYNNRHFLNVPFLMGPYLNDLANGVTLAKSYLPVVQADDDVEAVGHALIALWTQFMVAEARKGIFTQARWLQYRDALNVLIAEAQPHCLPLGGVPNGDLYSQTCSYNGKTVTVTMRVNVVNGSTTVSVDGGAWEPGSLDTHRAGDLVMRETSRHIAQDIIETMRRRGLIPQG